MASYLGPKVPSENLVLYLDAANPDSYSGVGSTWYDLSGYGNNGTLNGSYTFSNVNKGYIDLPSDYSSPNYVEIADNASIQFTNEFTLFLWVKFENEITDFYRTLFGKPSFYNYGIIVEWIGGNQILIDFTDSEFFDRNAVGYLSPSFDSWNFVVQTYSIYIPSNNHTGYIFSDQGKSIIQSTYLYPVLTNNDNLYINDFYSGGLGTKISIAGAYNKCLSSSEVELIYNSTKGRFGL